MTDWCTQRLVVQHDTGQPAIQFESMVGDGRHPGLKCPTNNCWRKMHKSSSERRTDGNDDGETTPHSRVMYCAVQYWRNLERIIGTVLEDFYSTVHSSRGNPRCKTIESGDQREHESSLRMFPTHSGRPSFAILVLVRRDSNLSYSQKAYQSIPKGVTARLSVSFGKNGTQP